MTSLILNLFNSLDNSNQNNSNKNIKKQINQNNISTPALNQGSNFNNYQNKTKNFNKSYPTCSFLRLMK